MISFPSSTPSLYRRIACMVYEGTLLFGILFIAAYLFAMLLQQHHALVHRNALTAWLGTIAGGYFVGFWTHSGQTVAMKTWRIQLRDAHGASVSTLRAIMRYFASALMWLPPLALHPLVQLSVAATLAVAVAWFIFWIAASQLGPSRQFLHDRLAGTRLVTASYRQESDREKAR